MPNDEMLELYLKLQKQYQNQDVLTALPILVAGMAIRDAIDQAAKTVAEAIRDEIRKL